MLNKHIGKLLWLLALACFVSVILLCPNMYNIDENNIHVSITGHFIFNLLLICSLQTACSFLLSKLCAKYHFFIKHKYFFAVAIPALVLVLQCRVFISECPTMQDVLSVGIKHFSLFLLSAVLSFAANLKLRKVSLHAGTTALGLK